MMVFLFVCRRNLFSSTKSDTGLEQVVLYAHILAFSQVFVAMEAMAEGVLSGAGDNKRLFWLSAPFNIARIPLAYFFCFTLAGHAAGIWWAINITTYIKCALKWQAVYKGKWRTLGFINHSCITYEHSWVQTILRRSHEHTTTATESLC